MDKISLGNLIRTRRKMLNITQQDIADYFNISVQAVSKWENGISYPDFVLLGDLSSLLKININDLLSLNNPNDQYIETKKFNYQTFGQNIKKYLRHYKITQKELENKLETLNQSSISSIINGKTYPTIKQFIELSHIFKVSYNDLYYSIYTIQENGIDKKSKRAYKIFYLLFSCFLLSFILIYVFSKEDNNSNNSIDDKYKYIEFWDENDNLIDAQKIEANKKISYYPEIYVPFGWSKEINTAKASTIYKMNKNPASYYFRIHTNKGDTFNKCYDDLSEFNIYELSGTNYYVTSLYKDNNEPFVIDNIAPGVYEIYGNTKTKQTHTISFPIEFGLSPITIRDCDNIPKLPLFSYNDKLIIGWQFNSKELITNKPYSFEQSIEATPIYHNQETIISPNGIINNLISHEESIVVPDSINDIKIKGIEENAIKLQKNNKKIIFMNDNEILLNNAFYNQELLSNIKDISITCNVFSLGSKLNGLTSLNSLEIRDALEAKTSNLPKLRIHDLFDQNNYHINNLYFGNFAIDYFSFENLNVNNIYYTSGMYLTIAENDFRNCNLSNFYFKSSFLAFSSLDLLDSCFINCKNLKSFDFPSQTTLYGNSHFYNCESLKEINMYGKINMLSDNMFYNTKINNLYIREVENIKQNAFNNMPLEVLEIAKQTTFENVCYIPSSVKNIYIGGSYDTNINIQSSNKYLMVHYTDENILAKSKFNSSTFKVCLDCVCRHKGEKR